MGKFKKHPKHPLYREAIKHHSGFTQIWENHLPILKKGHFYKENVPVGGDAPKSFIRVYE